ncbi:CD209 antigen-like protein C [Brachionichthys hirsutus]|uniref:CD209 antigen-like protein C n=1 Tax=Brachionichthys hirsutus TaxID=412623 RepID=UPI0036048D94
MSGAGTAPRRDRLYSKLIDGEGHDAAGLPAVVPARATPGRGGPGSYRLATICLATLCAALLIAVIAMATHGKSPPLGGAEAAGEVRKQTQEVNVSALMASISRVQQEKEELQQEKEELQQEKEELQDRLCATEAPELLKPTAKATPAPIVCPANWYLLNNSCYFISGVARDWPESKSYCESKGGYLAIIHTAEEQTFLWDLLPRGHWNTFWFGITDEHTEDRWKWVDGTPLVGGFWEFGEPNNHIDEDCGYIVKTRVLKRVAIRSWYDAPCSMDCRFICEKDMAGGAGGASTTMPH